MYEWNSHYFFASRWDLIYRHFGVISAVQIAGLICIAGLFVVGLWRGRRWKHTPIGPGENVGPDMWFARCGVWVAVVAFLLGWIPQMRWLYHDLATGIPQDWTESLIFDAFGNLYIGSIVLTIGFAQYFVLHFILSGVAIKRALTEAIPVVYPVEDVDKNTAT